MPASTQPVYQHMLFTDAKSADYLSTNQNLVQRESIWANFGAHHIRKLFHEPSWWPVDRLGNVFLPRAVRQIGKLAFGLQFQRLNFDTLKILVQIYDAFSDGRNELDDDDGMQRLLFDLVCAGSMIDKSFLGIDRPEDRFSLNFRDSTVALVSYFSFLGPQFLRYRAIENELVDAFCSGRIKTFGRAKRGGSFRNVDSEAWLIDDWAEQTRDGIISLFDVSELESLEQFLFIKEDELQNVANKISAQWGINQGPQIASATEEPSNSALQKYASPYIRMMLEITREFKITADNQPQKQILESWIYKNWSRFLTEQPKPTLIGYIATLTREPSSQAGARKNSIDP